MSRIREATVDDAAPLHRLVEERDARRYPPAVTRALFGDFDRERARTFVAEHDGTLQGMSVAVARELANGARTLQAAYWTDLFVRPAARKLMLYPPLALATLRGALASGAHVVYTANRRREVWEAHLRLGCRLAGALPTLARPLRPIELGAAYVGAPAVLRRLAKVPDAAWAAIEAHRKLRSGSPSGFARIVVDPVKHTAADWAELAALRAREAARTLHWRLDAGALRRRFAGNREAEPYELLVAREAGALAGALAWRKAVRDGVTAGIVLEAIAPDPGTLRALASAAEERARAVGAQAMAVLDGVASHRTGWHHAGYRATPEWYVLLIHPAERASDPLLGNAATWRFAFADHDAF
jgi:hypothetical protein